MDRLNVIIKKNTFLRSLLGGVRSLYMRYFYNYRKHMGFCHPTAIVSRPMIIKNPKNVFLYEGTCIKDLIIMTPNAYFIMKKGSTMVEGGKIITGSHERRVGRFFLTITEQEKNKDLDQDVIIEEDAWVGVNVTLLQGVVVGRGSTIGAGAVVTKSTPPYSVNAGVPCKFIKFYWTIDEILEHESQLYPEKERFTRTQLEEIFSQYSNK